MRRLTLGVVAIALISSCTHEGSRSAQSAAPPDRPVARVAPTAEQASSDGLSVKETFYFQGKGSPVKVTTGDPPGPSWRIKGYLIPAPSTEPPRVPASMPLDLSFGGRRHSGYTLSYGLFTDVRAHAAGEPLTWRNVPAWVLEFPHSCPIVLRDRLRVSPSTPKQCATAHFVVLSADTGTFIESF